MTTIPRGLLNVKLIEPPCTERYARWCERSAAKAASYSIGALIYGGDDVSQEEWSNRGWRSREGIRYDLVMLCKELVNVI